MLYYKGVYFADGKLVPAGFDASAEQAQLAQIAQSAAPRANKLLGLLAVKINKEARRIDEQLPLRVGETPYTNDQIKARTFLQTYLSDNAAKLGIAKVSYAEAAAATPTQAERFNFLHGYLSYLTTAHGTAANAQAEIQSVSAQLESVLAQPQGPRA